MEAALVRRKIPRLRPSRLVGRVVRVYWNRRQRVWSVKLDGARVAGHAAEILLDDVRFVVYERARLRCVESGRRSPHAFAVGTVAPAVPYMTRDLGRTARVRYNPFAAAHFTSDTGPVAGAESAAFTRDGAVLAHRPRFFS